MSFFIDAQDGYYALTTAGYAALAVLMVGLIIAAAFLSDKKQSAKMSAKELTVSAMALALAFVLSYVKIIPMPWGGSVTLCSMFFVTIVGYFYGAKMGLIAALSYGILQLLQDGGGYMLSPLQICCDYLFAFMALGVSGFFANKKNGLITGYIAAILLRGVFASLAGYLFWMDYMPENFPQSLAAVYPIAYNYAYILAEGIATVIILLIPSVNKAVKRVKTTVINS